MENNLDPSLLCVIERSGRNFTSRIISRNLGAEPDVLLTPTKTNFVDIPAIYKEDGAEIGKVIYSLSQKFTASIFSTFDADIIWSRYRLYGTPYDPDSEDEPEVLVDSGALTFIDQPTEDGFTIETPSDALTRLSERPADEWENPFSKSRLFISEDVLYLLCEVRDSVNNTSLLKVYSCDYNGESGSPRDIPGPLSEVYSLDVGHGFIQMSFTQFEDKVLLTFSEIDGFEIEPDVFVNKGRAVICNSLANDEWDEIDTSSLAGVSPWQIDSTDYENQSVGGYNGGSGLRANLAILPEYSASTSEPKFIVFNMASGVSIHDVPTNSTFPVGTPVNNFSDTLFFETDSTGRPSYTALSKKRAFICSPDPERGFSLNIFETIDGGKTFTTAKIDTVVPVSTTISFDRNGNLYFVGAETYSEMVDGEENFYKDITLYSVDTNVEMNYSNLSSEEFLGNGFGNIDIYQDIGVFHLEDSEGGIVYGAFFTNNGLLTVNVSGKGVRDIQHPFGDTGPLLNATTVVHNNICYGLAAVQTMVGAPTHAFFKIDLSEEGVSILDESTWEWSAFSPYGDGQELHFGKPKLCLIGDEDPTILIATGGLTYTTAPGSYVSSYGTIFRKEPGEGWEVIESNTGIHPYSFTNHDNVILLTGKTIGELEGVTRHAGWSLDGGDTWHYQETTDAPLGTYFKYNGVDQPVFAFSM